MEKKNSLIQFYSAVCVFSSLSSSGYLSLFVKKKKHTDDSFVICGGIGPRVLHVVSMALQVMLMRRRVEVKSTTGKPKKKTKKLGLQKWSQTSGDRESLFLTPSLLELDYVQKSRYGPDRHSKLVAQQD